MTWIKWKCMRLAARMDRDRSSPTFSARGWAIGMFYGCTIPFGFQLILSIPTAFLLKGSKIGATLGTFITNHFSIFLIYPMQCWLGSLILSCCGCHVSSAMQMAHQLVEVGRIPFWEAQFWVELSSLGGDVFLSFFVGGFLLACVCVPLTYWGVFHFVQYRRKRRQEKNEHKFVPQSKIA